MPPVPYSSFHVELYLHGEADNSWIRNVTIEEIDSNAGSAQAGGSNRANESRANGRLGGRSVLITRTVHTLGRFVHVHQDRCRDDPAVDAHCGANVHCRLAARCL